MEAKKKIILRQSEIQICKSLALGFVDEARAKAEAEGTPFDYEAEKAKQEHEFILAYAKEKQKTQEWEETRDKGFHIVIGELIASTKLYNYVRENVPNLKALRDMDPADVLAANGYGKKTAAELKTLQERLGRHRSIMPRLNKAIDAHRRFQGFRSEHRDIINTYKNLQRNADKTQKDFELMWRRYGQGS
jgi:hypothetical protein